MSVGTLPRHTYPSIRHDEQHEGKGAPAQSSHATSNSSQEIEWGGNWYSKRLPEASSFTS